MECDLSGLLPELLEAAFLSVFVAKRYFRVICCLLWGNVKDYLWKLQHGVAKPASQYMTWDNGTFAGGASTFSPHLVHSYIGPLNSPIGINVYLRAVSSFLWGNFKCCLGEITGEAKLPPSVEPLRQQGLGVGGLVLPFTSLFSSVTFIFAIVCH